MTSNPEFIKNIRLQLNGVKLVLMPMILGMIFFLAYISEADSYRSVEKTMQITALVLFGGIVFIWGTKMAVDSLAGEFNDRTWDSQRMTAISPWDLVQGKLFGSTLYAWYGGLLCLLVYICVALSTTEPSRYLDVLLFLIFAGIFVQSTLLAFILTEFAKNRDLGKLNLSSYSVAGLIASFVMISSAMGGYDTRDLIHWYGIELYSMRMMLCSALFFCPWGLIALYRAMRKELQFDTAPWVWTLFVLSLMLYGSGFVTNSTRIDGVQSLFFGLYISFFIGIASFYLMALAEPKSIVDIRWLADKAEEKKWGECFAQLPAWFMSLLLTILLCTVVLCMKLVLHTQLTDGPSWLADLAELPPLAFLLFCLRDLGIILYVNLISTGKNRDLVAGFYLGLLYGLIPGILNAADVDYALPWFYPSGDTFFLNAHIPIALQAGNILFLLYRLLAKDFRKHRENKARLAAE